MSQMLNLESGHISSCPVDVTEEGDRRRIGRPKMRWKDCVKRDLERAGTKGQEWKTIAEDRGRCRELTTKVEEATK